RTAAAPAGRIHVEIAPECPLQAGVDVPIRLKLTGARAGLEPYLGAWAHVVVIGKDLDSFSHAHPLEAAVHTHVTSGPPPQEVTIVSSFPHPGEYRLWAQFQQSGKVVTAPFVLQVAAAAPTAAPTKPAIPRDAIRIRVTQHGYDPSSLEVPAGKPVTLAFTREGAPNCGSEVVFPALGIRQKLPLNQTVLVQLPAQPKSELAFSCGMGMFRGMLVV